MNRIIVERGISKKLQEIFGVSHVAVRLALKGEYKGRISEEKASRIRKAANAL